MEFMTENIQRSDGLLISTEKAEKLFGMQVDPGLLAGRQTQFFKDLCFYFYIQFERMFKFTFNEQGFFEVRLSRKVGLEHKAIYFVHIYNVLHKFLAGYKIENLPPKESADPYSEENVLKEEIDELIQKWRGKTLFLLGKRAEIVTVPMNETGLFKEKFLKIFPKKKNIRRNQLMKNKAAEAIAETKNINHVMRSITDLWQCMIQHLSKSK